MPDKLDRVGKKRGLSERPSLAVSKDGSTGHAMYDNSPGFIAICEGPNHTFTYTNIAYETFVNRSELIGKNVADALPETISQGFVKLLDRVFATGEPFIGTDMELALNATATGQPEPRYCDFVYQPVFDSDGSVTGIFCEGFDVTHRRNVETRLAALQDEMIHLSRLNAMGAMAATLAHELSQPLAAIANYAAAGERHLDAHGSDNRGLAREAIRAIADTTERTGEIIKSIRDLTANRQITKTEFELTAAIAECTKLVSVGIHANLEIVDRTKASIMVKANRIQIQQVIINLLSNAAEAALNGDHHQIEICAFVDDGMINLCVKDGGRGVSALVAEALFTSKETTKKSGMGIGLSVSRAIVEAHGGQIWLEETGPKGSAFCFTLRHSEMAESEIDRAPVK